MVTKVLIAVLAIVLIIVLAMIPWALAVMFGGAAVLWWYKQRRWKAETAAANRRGEDPLRGVAQPSALRVRLLGPYLASVFPGRPSKPRD